MSPCGGAWALWHLQCGMCLVQSQCPLSPAFWSKDQLRLPGFLSYGEVSTQGRTGMWQLSAASLAELADSASAVMPELGSPAARGASADLPSTSCPFLPTLLASSYFSLAGRGVVNVDLLELGKISCGISSLSWNPVGKLQLQGRWLLALGSPLP